jgi:catechol 2,3-dioxygenase-like lactoylglutathione lyase family enzyme
MQLSRVSAIMLGVRDLPQALAFYKEKLGLKVMMQEPQLALLQCGTVMLGLSRAHAHAAPHVAGATEVVFQVETVRAAHRALAAQGVSFVHRATSGHANGLGRALPRCRRPSPLHFWT